MKTRISLLTMLLTLVFLIPELSAQMVDCTGIPPWDGNDVYNAGGQRVVKNCKLYESRWWTQGEDPETSGEWGVWRFIGYCIGCGGNDAPTATLTAPLNGDSFIPGAVVNITANANDTDGTVTQVEFLANDITITVDLTPPYSADWTPPNSGVYQIVAIATDDSNATGSSAVHTITVGALNDPPSVSITSPANGTVINTGDIVNITADAADTDGTVTQVEFFYDGISIGTDATSPYSINWSNAPAGLHELTAVATDNDNASTTSAIINVQVSGGGGCTAPQYVAGTSYATGEEVQNNGDLFQCLVGGWCSSDAAWAYEPGQGSAWQSAWELIGVCDTSVTTNEPPLVDVTAPVQGAIYTVGDNVIITADASDIDGTVTQVEFFAAGGSLGIDNQAPYTITWTNVPLGTQEITATATDDDNATASSTVTITVNPADNIPPDVHISAPLSGSSFDVGQNILITAVSTDTDGTVTKVEFYQGAIKLGEDLTAPYEFTWTNAAAGAYTLTAVSTDNDNASTTSDIVNITVNDPFNEPPVTSITSPNDGATFTFGTDILITASASDPDGSIAKVEFFDGTTRLGEDLTSPFNYNFSGAALGPHSLTVRATDNLDAVTTSLAMNVTVIPADTGTGDNLTLANLPLQVNFNQGTSKTYTFDGPISSILSRNRDVISVTVSGNQASITGLKPGRTGLKITSNGQHYYMGLRVNKPDGSMPGLPQYLSVGSVSEDKAADITFWEDIDTDLTNKEMDIRYIYINGGPLAGWRSWGPDRPRVFAENSVRLGLIPFFVYYNIPDAGESYEGDLAHIRDVNYMTEYFIDLDHFMNEVQSVLQGELYGIVLEPDFLGYMQQNSGTTDPTQISCAVNLTTIAPNAGNVRTLVERINKTIDDKRAIGHNIFYGWQLNLWADPEAGYGQGVLRSTDDNSLGFDGGKIAVKKAGENTTLFAIASGTLTYGANFLSIDKYGLDAMGHVAAEDPFDSRWFFNNDHWTNYLAFVNSMHTTSGYPVVLWQLPVGHINSTQTISAYTGQAFPDLNNTDTKYEDSSSDFFLGDVFNPNTTVRRDYFAENKYADPKVSVAGNNITWGSHMQETKDAGVISVLFGAGVNSSTDGVGSPPTDDYFWIQKVQEYYNTGAPALDQEYGVGGSPCAAGCAPRVQFLSPVDGEDIILTQLRELEVNMAAFDVDGSLSSLSVSIGTQTFNPPASGASFALNWTPPAFGPYTLTATATDNSGQTTTESIAITVTEFDPLTCDAPAWDATVVYNVNGTEVSYDGKVFRSKWWTQGDLPIDGGPWEYVRPCSAPKSTIALSNNMVNYLEAYPNPFSDRLVFRFAAEQNAQASIKLYNSKGSLILSEETQSLSHGENRIELSTEELQEGIYFFQAIIGQESFSGKVIK